MEFVPFQAPQSEHHMLNTGLSTEGGVTAKGLVDGLNTYLGHLFAKVEGDGANVISTAKSAGPDIVRLIAALSDRITELEKWAGTLPSDAPSTATSTPQASTIAEDLKDAATMLADAKVAPAVETAAQAVKRIHDEAIAKLKADRSALETGVETVVAKNSLADVLAGLK